MTTQPRLSVIVVSFNTRDMTLECLRSVFDQTRAVAYELLVVDNASTDGSADAIAAEFGAAVRLMRSEENLGFAGANNLAAKHAVGSRLLLLNPDTVVTRAGIDRIMAFADDHPAAGIWGGRTTFADGALNPGSCWGRPTIWSSICQASGLASVCRGSSLLNPEGMGGWARDSVREVDIVSGCFLLIDRALWEALGGFDPAFFMYGEDADLCLRARAAGARPTITPDAQIVHYGGQSDRLRAGKIMKLYRARVQLMARHWPRWAVPIGCALLRLNVLRRLVVQMIRQSIDEQRGARDSGVFPEVWRRRREWLDGCDMMRPVLARPVVAMNGEQQ